MLKELNCPGAKESYECRTKHKEGSRIWILKVSQFDMQILKCFEGTFIAFNYDLFGEISVFLHFVSWCSTQKIYIKAYNHRKNYLQLES